MQIPLRVLRAQQEEATPFPPEGSARDYERRRKILTTARAAMARNGCHVLAFNTLAALSGMSAGIVRRYFADLDTLLYAILLGHLSDLRQALEAVPPEAPGAARARRTAYISCTRTAEGGLTEAHRLLVRDRYLLPPDLREPLEKCRRDIGEILAGERYEPVMALLDTPELTPAMIEQFATGSTMTGPHEGAGAPPRSAAPARQAGLHTEAPGLPSGSAGRRAGAMNEAKATLLDRAGLGHIVAPPPVHRSGEFRLRFDPRSARAVNKPPADPGSARDFAPPSGLDAPPDAEPAPAWYQAAVKNAIPDEGARRARGLSF